MKVQFLLVSLALASLSGCLSDDADQPVDQAGLDAEVDPAAQSVNMASSTLDVTWAASVGAPQAPGLLAILLRSGGEFQAAEGATATAVAQWTCGVPVCDVELRIWDDAGIIDSVQGSSPLEITVEDLPGTQWFASMAAIGPSVLMEGTIQVDASWSKE